MDERKDDLPAHCAAARDGPGARHESEEAPWSAAEPTGALEAPGATQEQILAQYPQLTRDSVAAAFQYAADVLKGEHVWDLKTTA
ncbi:MAG: DUF433 domain-containing protein [Vicinamibacterales bacterium]